MSTYKGKPAIINKSAQAVYAQMSDLSTLQTKLDSLPAEQLAAVGEIRCTTDSLTVVTPQIGELTFKVIERVEPSKVVFTAAGSPIPLTMAVNLEPKDTDSCVVTTSIDIEIPAVMRAMVGSKLQQAADKFGEMIGTLNG